MRRLLPLLSGLLLSCLAAAPAAAHPHVWLDATLALEMEEGKVTALAITWRFDDFYSELVRQDFDQDGDGTLSQTELDALVGVSASSLTDFSFFTHMMIDGEQPAVKAVKDFYIEDDGTQVTYRFRVPLRQPVVANETPFAVGLFDKSYYVDIALNEQDISLSDPSCRMVPKEALDQPMYYGMIYPTYFYLTCGSV